MKFISFFAGIGGIDLGLERAGHECVGQCEIDPYALKVLEKHWPDVPRFGDIREIDANELPEADMWTGGDPCQENSAANRGRKGTAPSMGGGFIRIIAEGRPRFVLRENPSRCRSEAPWPWQRFRAELEKIGYLVLPIKLRACCFGLGHQRERMFLLAMLPDADGVSGAQTYQAIYASRDSQAVRPSANRYRGATPSSVPWPIPPSLICGTSDGVPSRVDRLRCLGNAVVPQVAEYIGRLLAKI